MLLGALALPVVAQQQPLWEFGLGVGGLTLPDYRGSDERTNYVFPLPYFIYRGERLRVDREGAQGFLYKSPRVEFDVSLSAGNPADSDDNEAREGMDDLHPTVEAGPRLTINLFGNAKSKYRLQFQLPVRAVTEIDGSNLNHIGWTTNPLLNLDIRDVAGGWDMGMQVGPVYGSSEYHEYYYSVAPRQARAGRPAYDAGGGYSGTQFSVGASRRMGQWWMGTFVRYYDLHGASFDDSPLVKQKDAFMAGFGFAYVFARSSTMVDAER